MRIGTTELMVILLIVVIVFGPSQIPKLAQMFKKSSKSFKEGMEEADQQVKEAGNTVKTEVKEAVGKEE